MFDAQYIAYDQTNSFSRIVIDYLNHAPELRPFYTFDPDLKGIANALEQKKNAPVDRAVLVEVLKDQYQSVSLTDAVRDNINALLSSDTFTICTAHQPNLLTGPLYFLYKILHAIRLATALKEQFPANNFVPVYYMGSEDADLEELNHFSVQGKKYSWNTNQKGAVGRMFVDKKLIALIDELEAQVGVEPYGKEIVRIFREAYTEKNTIQDATFKVVNSLFSQFGLIVLIADDARLKKLMLPTFEKEIFQQESSKIVSATSERLNQHYNVQAHPREINLFYLKEDIRERIIAQEELFLVNNTDLKFTSEELKEELYSHPERFSPNVILRGLYQETILPNLAFIGGGGELAYWLQLKELFQSFQVPFPVLVLRNSFLILEKKWQERIKKLGFEWIDCFNKEEQLMKSLVGKNTTNKVSLNGNFEIANSLFDQIRMQAEAIDPTLSKHVTAIKTRSLKTLQELEKKMYRAEKRKFSDQQSQIRKMRSELFPGNGLQERVDNISYYYAKWGKEFIDLLYHYSPALDMQFCILLENERIISDR